MVLTKEEALELFADNPFKIEILTTKVPDGTRTTVYKCGDLIDLCRGPHVANTGKVKAFSTTRHSASYWLGDAENDSLQRLYGISFPDKKQLKVWQENMEKVGSASLEPAYIHPYGIRGDSNGWDNDEKRLFRISFSDYSSMTDKHFHFR
jgi:Threonyl and Alanyl tRNA synthetase second additional domain